MDFACISQNDEQFHNHNHNHHHHYHYHCRVQKFVLITGAVFFIIHIFSCVFWLLKRSTNSAEELADFLAGFAMQPDSTGEKWILSGYFMCEPCCCCCCCCCTWIISNYFLE